MVIRDTREGMLTKMKPRPFFFYIDRRIGEREKGFFFFFGGGDVLRKIMSLPFFLF